MSSHQPNHTAFTQQNLVGNGQHRQFLELQAAHGIAQRGGMQLPAFLGTHHARLVSDINLLDGTEKRKLIFDEAIISN